MLSRFRCEQNEDLGRYLVSEKDFDLGDVVWEESPLFSAPYQRQLLTISNIENWIFTCVGCYQKIDDDAMKCPKCHWPCCSVNCSKSEKHKNYECELFSRLGITASPENFSKLLSLRIVLSKDVEPVKYEKFFDLSSEYYEPDEVFRKKCDDDVFKFLAQDCEMDISIDEVSQLLAATRINNFAIHNGGYRSREHAGVALYFYTSLLSNSCCPNVGFTFVKNMDRSGDVNWNIRLYARKPIKKGSILSIAYNLIDSPFGTVHRQIQIHKRHNFICKCERCLDKTEGGTYFQAVVCPKCKNKKGYLLPTNPIEINSPWKCDKCNHMKEAHKVGKLTDLLKPVPFSLLCKKGEDARSLKLADHFIVKQKRRLHENHYLMFHCALYWLLESDFSGDLISSVPAAKTNFIKIMTRVKRYLPLCENFMRSKTVSKMHLMVAETYAAYFFKSPDMKVCVQGNDSTYFKLRICNRIVAYLKSSLVWLKMRSITSSYERDADLLNQKIVRWSKAVQKFEKEIRTTEERTLKSIRFLFHPKQRCTRCTVL